MQPNSVCSGYSLLGPSHRATECPLSRPHLGWGFQGRKGGPRPHFEQICPYQKGAEALCPRRGVHIELSCQLHTWTQWDLQAYACIRWMADALWASSSLPEMFIQPCWFPPSPWGTSLWSQNCLVWWRRAVFDNRDFYICQRSTWIRR